MPTQAYYTPLVSMYIYLFPTELEAAAFRKARPNAETIISGVGMAATAATIASIYKHRALTHNDCIILAGIAGTYSDAVPIGEVVEVVSEECAELPQRFQRTYIQPTPLTQLRQVSSATVHSSHTEPSNVYIENMEGATLMAMAEVLGFRYVEIRAISNHVGDSFPDWQIEKALTSLTTELIRIEDGE